MVPFPIRLEANGEAPEPGRVGAPLALALVILIALFFGLYRLAAAHALPETMARPVLWLAATWVVQPPPMAAPYQWWTHVLVNESWWAAIADLLVLALCAPALERRFGQAGFLVCLLVLVPLSTIAVIVVHRPAASTIAGSDGLAASMLGLGWAIFPQHRVRWALPYYLIRAVGVVRFTTSVNLVALLFLFQAVLRHAWLGVPGGGLTVLVDVTLGVAIGTLLRAALRTARA